MCWVRNGRPRRAAAVRGRRLPQRDQLIRAGCRSDRHAPSAAAPRAAAASSPDRGSAGRPCAGGAPSGPSATNTFSPPSRRSLRSGLRPVWYIAVALAIGDGRKVWTWSARKPFRFSHSARFSMSRSRGAGMRRDEVRDQILLLSGRFRCFVEQALELFVAADAGLHHLRRAAPPRCARARSSGSRRRGGSPARARTRATSPPGRSAAPDATSTFLTPGSARAFR